MHLHRKYRSTKQYINICLLLPLRSERFSTGLYLHREMRDKQLPMQKNLLGVFCGLWM